MNFTCTDRNIEIFVTYNLSDEVVEEYMYEHGKSLEKRQGFNFVLASLVNTPKMNTISHLVMRHMDLLCSGPVRKFDLSLDSSLEASTSNPSIDEIENLLRENLLIIKKKQEELKHQKQIQESAIAAFKNAANQASTPDSYWNLTDNIPIPKDEDLSRATKAERVLQFQKMAIEGLKSFDGTSKQEFELFLRYIFGDNDMSDLVAYGNYQEFGCSQLETKVENLINEISADIEKIEEERYQKAVRQWIFQFGSEGLKEALEYDLDVSGRFYREWQQANYPGFCVNQGFCEVTDPSDEGIERLKEVIEVERKAGQTTSPRIVVSGGTEHILLWDPLLIPGQSSIQIKKTLLLPVDKYDYEDKYEEYDYDKDYED